MKTRVAVVGAGAFGRNHCRVVSRSSRATLAAVVDSDPARTRAAAEEFGGEALTDWRALRGKADAAIVAAPTVAHAEIGCGLIEMGLDVLVEKPIAPTLDEADALVVAAARHFRVLQVGHLERFNPAVAAVRERLTLPLFFEIHRMSLFTARSLDVDVVLDLMIHDLDIVLALTGAQPEEIRAAGISILSPKPDIANVRLQFANGCVANLTASRVSTDKVRKLRIFQPGQYLSLDYARQDLAVITVKTDAGDPGAAAGWLAALAGKPGWLGDVAGKAGLLAEMAGGRINLEQVAVPKGEPLARQFDAFLDSIASRQSPETSGASARQALGVALDILDKMREHSQVVEQSLRGWKPR